MESLLRWQGFVVQVTSRPLVGASSAIPSYGLQRIYAVPPLLWNGHGNLSPQTTKRRWRNTISEVEEIRPPGEPDTLEYVQQGTQVQLLRHVFFRQSEDAIKTMRVVEISLSVQSPWWWSQFERQSLN